MKTSLFPHVIPIFINHSLCDFKMYSQSKCQKIKKDYEKLKRKKCGPSHHQNEILKNINGSSQWMQKKHLTKYSALSWMGAEGIRFNTSKAVYDQSTARIMLNGEKLETFQLYKDDLSHPFSFNIVTEFLVEPLVKRKKFQGRTFSKQEIKLWLFTDYMMPTICKEKGSTKKAL